MSDFTKVLTPFRAARSGAASLPARQRKGEWPVPRLMASLHYEDPRSATAGTGCGVVAASSSAGLADVASSLRAAYPVEVIGTWAHADATVEEITRREDFWEYAEVQRAALMALMAGGLDPAHALDAVIAPEGDMVLADGCHRYSVARDLGIASLPVRLGQWDDWFADAGPEPGTSSGDELHFHRMQEGG